MDWDESQAPSEGSGEQKSPGNESDTANPPDDDAVISAEIERLAALSDGAYERERKKTAQTLGIRITKLDKLVRIHREQRAEPEYPFLSDPEPCDEAVDGAQLLTEIRDWANAHISLPAFGAVAIALWVILTWVRDAAVILPILLFTSPTPACGKSVAMTFLSQVVKRPLLASNLTKATVYRAIEEFGPTLLADEYETYSGDDDGLRGVVNCGHLRSTAYVLRCEGDDHKPRLYSAWGAKAVAQIGKPHATLLSRSIQLELKRLAPGQTVAPLRVDRENDLSRLRPKLARWAADHFDELRDHEPDIPPELHGRVADNWRSLLAIADIAGGPWPDLARKAAVTSNATVSEQTAGIMLLEDIRRLFDEFRE